MATTDLATTYLMASTQEKLQLCASLLLTNNLKSEAPLTACELARIALAQAIITEALACGPGPTTPA